MFCMNFLMEYNDIALFERKSYGIVTTSDFDMNKL